MKYTKYIIVPALAILASCGNQEGGGLSNAELDAKVAAKVKAATEQLSTDCDARIQQTAQMKADSILAHAKVPAATKPATPTQHKDVVVAPVHHDKPVVKHEPKTEKEKVNSLFDKKAQADKAKGEANKVKDVFKNNGQKTEKEIKKEEDKVKSLFNK